MSSIANTTLVMPDQGHPRDANQAENAKGPSTLMVAIAHHCIAGSVEKGAPSRDNTTHLHTENMQEKATQEVHRVVGSNSHVSIGATRIMPLRGGERRAESRTEG
jgi:hypothetical protein